MFFRFLKSETFSIAASFILAFGIMAVLKPGCKGDSCRILKAPPLDEVKSTTYQLGSKCYQFKVEGSDCPSTGVIEGFERRIS